MKALTLLQPWAHLVVTSAKEFETRSWMTAHRGPLAIHAGKGVTGDGRALAESLGIPDGDLVYGSVIGIVWVIGMEKTEVLWSEITEEERQVGDWRRGRYGWRLGSPMRLERPVPASGAQKIWQLLPPAAGEVWSQIVFKGWPDY